MSCSLDKWVSNEFRLESNEWPLKKHDLSNEYAPVQIHIYISTNQKWRWCVLGVRDRSKFISIQFKTEEDFSGKFFPLFVLSSSWFLSWLKLSPTNISIPKHFLLIILELFVSLIWTIHRKIQQSCFYECNLNVNLLIDFSKFVQWLHHVPSDTLPLEIGVRGRPRHISRTGIRMLSTGSYRQLVPSGWIVQYFSNIADLQIRIQFDLPTTSVQPSSNVCLSFLFSLPPLLSIDAISLEGLMQTKHHSPLIEAG